MDCKILTNIPILMLSTSKRNPDGPACVIAAPLPVDLSPNLKGFSYWLSDVVITPTRKFTTSYEDESEKGRFGGWRYYDVLREPDWPNPKYWTEIQAK